MPEEVLTITKEKYLEPLADEKTELHILSTVDRVDNRTSPLEMKYMKIFGEYLEYIKTVFTSVIEQLIGNYSIEGIYHST